MAGLRTFGIDTPEVIRLDDGREFRVPERMTLAEFEAVPWPEKQHWELIEGTPIMSPAPIPLHQLLMFALAYQMKAWANELGDFVVLQDEDIQPPGTENYVRPDVNVFRAEDVDLNRVPVRAIPVIVAEVLSPSTAGDDWSLKTKAFAEAGIKEYWIADPATGNLSIMIKPRGGRYSHQSADAQGFVESPFFKRRVRIRFVGKDFKVESRPAK